MADGISSYYHEEYCSNIPYFSVSDSIICYDFCKKETGP